MNEPTRGPAPQQIVIKQEAATSGKQLRMVDLSKEECLDVPASVLLGKIYSTIEALETARHERVESVLPLAGNVEEAMELFIGYVAGVEVKGKALLFNEAMEYVKTLSDRINKMYWISNALAASGQAMVKINLKQAEEFGL